jgi:pyruvate dehydrogenase E1 component beta subunit
VSRQLTYVKAFNEGMHQIMTEDPDVFLVGEDVAGYGGVFHMFDGLLTTFGDKRVKDTPIAEQAIIGLGVGAAARGLRPVCDLMFMDFLGVAMDQVANQAAKMKYMFGGAVSLPLTITTAGGAGMSAAAQHSQSLEAWIAHVPGLKVVMPASPYDAKGLIVASIRDDNPVIVVLNKKMLGVKGEVPEEIYSVPIGVANVVREGSDVTIVAIGRMVVEATKAAAALEERGVSVELIDPRSVQPLDIDTIVTCARPTACSSCTRQCSSAASAPRSPRRSRRPRSTISMRQSRGSLRRSRPSLTRRSSRTPTCRTPLESMRLSFACSSGGRAWLSRFACPSSA